MMSKEEGYNGYTNYQTWNVCLWINNDEGLYNYWRERAKENPDNLEEELQAWAEENQPELNGLYADLLTNALGWVEWREVADAIREE